MTKMCSIDGCERDTSKGANGLCGMHYLRWTRYGRLTLVVNRGSGWSINSAGYIVLFIDGKHVYEHIYVAEQALGKSLPKGAIVHHMNNRPSDNFTPFNLVICPNQAYHLLLHRRMKELGYGQDN